MIQKMKRVLGQATILLVAVGVLAGMAWIVKGRSQQIAKGEASTTVESVPARIYTVQWNQTKTQRSLTGLVESRYSSEMAFRVSGKIESRLVDVGDRVTKGDALFKLELKDYELELQSSEAELASAVATLKQATSDELRMKSLRTTGSVSVDDYDKSLAAREVANARHTAAQRSLELARNRLTYTTLEAPADGIVTAIFAERGQVVAEGRAVAKLTQGDSWEVVVGVPEKNVSGLRDSEAEITFWSLPNKTSRAQLRELSPVPDPATRTYEARFTILDAPPDLQLGMSATLHLRDLVDTKGIFIPAGALVGRQDRFARVAGEGAQSAFVWKVVDNQGHIQPIPVQVNNYGENEVLVEGELRSGDRIVSSGVHKLDAAMTVLEWEELK